MTLIVEMEDYVLGESVILMVAELELTAEVDDVTPPFNNAFK